MERLKKMRTASRYHTRDPPQFNRKILPNPQKQNKIFLYDAYGARGRQHNYATSFLENVKAHKDHLSPLHNKECFGDFPLYPMTVPSQNTRPF